VTIVKISLVKSTVEVTINAIFVCMIASIEVSDSSLSDCNTEDSKKANNNEAKMIPNKINREINIIYKYKLTLIYFNKTNNTSTLCPS